MSNFEMELTRKKQKKNHESEQWVRILGKFLVKCGRMCTSGSRSDAGSNI